MTPATVSVFGAGGSTSAPAAAAPLPSASAASLTAAPTPAHTNAMASHHLIMQAAQLAANFSPDTGDLPQLPVSASASASASAPPKRASKKRSAATAAAANITAQATAAATVTNTNEEEAPEADGEAESNSVHKSKARKVGRSTVSIVPPAVASYAGSDAMPLIPPPAAYNDFAMQMQMQQYAAAAASGLPGPMVPPMGVLSSSSVPSGPTVSDPNGVLSGLSTMRPAPFFTPAGLFMSEPDPFGQETPSLLKFPTWSMLDEFIKALSVKNGFRHVLRRSHKDEKGDYRHGTYVCEFHAAPQPQDLAAASAGSSGQPTRASSRSIRLSCPYKINFARQGEHGPYHVNKRIMQHSHVIDTGMTAGLMAAGGGSMSMQMNMAQMNAALLSSGATGILPLSTPVGLSGAAGAAAVAAAAAAASNSSPTLTMSNLNTQPAQSILRATAAAVAAAGAHRDGHTKLPFLAQLLNVAHPASLDSQSPMTESSNSLSSKCDQSTPLQLVRMMREVDSQLFNGFGGMSGIFDSDMVDLAVGIAARLRSALNQPAGSKVIIAGAATSGRIAAIIAQIWSPRLAQRGITLTHLLAGGPACMVATPGGQSGQAEDNAALGREDLSRQVAGATSILYIGVSCGLSSAYIAGQLDLCAELLASKLVPLHVGLIGFNRVQQAVTSEIHSWPADRPAGSNTFKAVIESINAFNQASEAEAAMPVTILTPTVGPEFLTGNTRLKGATATFIIIDSILTAALNDPTPASSSSSSSSIASDSLRSVYLNSLRSYESVFRDTYLHTHAIAACVESVSQSLAPSAGIAAAGAAGASAATSPGRVFYLSLGSSSTLFGSIGLIDSADLHDTFGSGYTSVQSFFRDGICSLTTDSMKPDSDHAPFTMASLANFREIQLATLTERDTVIILVGGPFDEDEDGSNPVNGANTTTPESITLLRSIESRTHRLFGLHFHSGVISSSDPLLSTLRSILSSPRSLIDVSVGSSSHAAIATKMILNIITTGGFVTNGFTLSNKTINLTITSTKLYARAITLIGELTSVSPDVAHRQLLRSIYHLDVIPDGILKSPIASHVSLAGSLTGVMPLALLLAECESSRLPAPTGIHTVTHTDTTQAQAQAGQTIAPAITIGLAMRRLQTATFTELMRQKYHG